MKARKWFLRATLGLMVFLTCLAGTSFVINLGLPQQSEVVDRLSAAEKARLAEFNQVRQKLGNTVWPEWGTAEIPIVVYNEAYVFLLGILVPSDGWLKVPQNEVCGAAWELVPDDLFVGEPYYRQPLPANGQTPEAFTIKVGDQWAASMPTMEWMEIELRNQMQSELPGFLASIFPYPIVTNLFLRGSDGYITLLAHESFHAFQGIFAPERLAAAETAVLPAEATYPWDDTALQTHWQTELGILAAAVQAESEAQMLDLAQAFLDQRVLRRQEAGLSETQRNYERQREWMEGLARFVELDIWQRAALAEAYESLPELANDENFSDYATFDKRWQQEVEQIGRMADDEGDGRFYYSGMAQAVILDRLVPDWKAQVLADGMSLENLLETAVAAED